MKIYLDVFFIVNLYVNYFLLLGVKNFYKLRTKNRRIFLGALIGGLTSLISLLMLYDVINYILAVIFGFFICFASFYKKEIKPIIKYYSAFLLISFAFSGLMLIFSTMTTNIAIIGGKTYFDISPIMLFLFTIIAYIISEILRKFRSTEENGILFHKIIVEQNGNKTELFAKNDTGNTLKEPFSGLPVMVAEIEFLDKICDIENDSFRLIPYHSLGGKGLLKAFKPEKIYDKNTGKNLECYIALYNGKLSTGSYNSLINPEILI